MEGYSDFDTHAHYDDKGLMKRFELMKNHRNGIDYILNAASDIDSTKMGIMLAEKYDLFIPQPVYTHNAENWPKHNERAWYLINSCKKVVAVNRTRLPLRFFAEKYNKMVEDTDKSG